MAPMFFIKQSDFREWLEKNSDKVTEILVGFYRVNSGKASITWSESVDEALCFGWIDSVRKTIDHESYSIRFTPRKSTSIWSAVNIKKMEEMIPKGVVKEAGLIAYRKRKEDKSGIYTHEQKDIQFTPEIESIFKENNNAWEFFLKQAPSYRKQITNWIIVAKQESTRLSRLKKLIDACEDKKRL